MQTRGSRKNVGMQECRVGTGWTRMAAVVQLCSMLPWRSIAVLPFFSCLENVASFV